MESSMRHPDESWPLGETKLAVLDVSPADWRCCVVEDNRRLWKAHLVFLIVGLPLVATSFVFQLPILLLPGAIFLLTSLVVWSVLCCCPQEDSDPREPSNGPPNEKVQPSSVVLNGISTTSLQNQNPNVEMSTPHVSSTGLGDTFAIGHPVSEVPSLDPRIVNSSREDQRRERRRFASMGALPNIHYQENRRCRTVSIA